MAYTSRAELERCYDIEEIAQLVVDDAALDAVVAAATGIVNVYLSLYQTPLVDPVPEVIAGITAEITRYRLWDDRAPLEVRKRFEDAMSILRDIAKGVVTLPGVPLVLPTPIELGGTIAFTERTRTFTDDTLGSFVERGDLSWPPRTD